MISKPTKPLATDDSLAGKEILLGVCGSIAAYKSVLLLRLLQEVGASVRVALTESAQRFVGKLTFASLSQHPIFDDLWDTTESWSQHVHLARAADVYIIAPTSAHTLAKLAHGLCDNPVTALALSAQCPILVCPAMDHEMYRHPQTQANLARIVQLGYHVLNPEEGYLASGIQGQGRLAAPEQIVQQAATILLSTPPRAHSPLAGTQVLITAGPTREPIDPVRYLSNHSTGKMGVALAQVARDLGAQVHLVHGPLQVALPQGVQCYAVDTAQQMLEQVQALHPQQQMLLFSAAVSDYTPEVPSQQKLKKQGDAMSLKLKQTADILAWAGAHRQAGQFVLGFALETEKGETHAREKLQKKGADAIVLNMQNEPGAGFGTDTNRVSIIDANATQALPLLTKIEVAQQILAYCIERRASTDKRNA